MAFGKPEDFHFEESEESFDNYRARLEQYFAANGLDTKEVKTKSVFLTVVGKRAHSLLMDLCAPNKPSEKTYEELVNLLQRHYVPKTNFIAERCKFHGRNQKDNETISEYVASLRKLAATCKFGTFLDEALRDRFVCGVKSSELRDRLLSTAHTKDLTLPLAVEMALSFEVTKDSAQQFAQKAFKAHIVDKKAKARYREATEKCAAVGKPCYRCGGKSHSPNDCRFKASECHECKKKGHIAKACRSRKEGGYSTTTKGAMHLDMEKRRPSVFTHQSCLGVSDLKPPQSADRGSAHKFQGDRDGMQLLSHHNREDRVASDVLVQDKMEAAPNSDNDPVVTLDSPDFGLFEINTDAPKVVSAVANYSAEIVEGSSVTLTCSSDANPAANYTWYKEQTVLSRQQQVFIRSMNSSDSGEYHCTAENELGRRTSESISVDVKYAPKLPSVSVSPSAEIVEGSSVTLTCSSDANPEANYTWYKENKSLFHGSVGEHSFSVHSKHSGNYFCKAENQHGQTNSSSLFIDVQYAPKLPSVSVSASAEIVEGSSVTLTCSSDANPAANYTWYKEDEDSPKASGQNFTITDVRHEHSGSYYCEAKNRRGRHNSTSCQINIASSVNSAAVGSITVLFLTLLILSAIIVIRKRRSLTQFFSRERPNSKVQQSVCPEYEDPSAAAQSAAAEQQEDLCYASVSFSKNQDDPVYSNIKPTKPSRQKEEDEEEAEYTLVKFSNGAQGLRGQQAVEDSCALYSTVNKIC
ncbi:Fc receptor-like protein 3 [Archocentrus centrarchus]|uniref:Fc receptor-like protein 3 n=1 Tax=Archocentrus centrarchus TaxID=63155 RepID=UPI0011EA3EE8|nr:Fc receptor-like protein 3 [Archocentrus centrarchus]